MYSLYDLFQDIEQGRETSFQYNNETFMANKIGATWSVTHASTGQVALYYGRVDCMLDFQGLAASLLFYNRNIVFGRDGELINGI